MSGRGRKKKSIAPLKSIVPKRLPPHLPFYVFSLLSLQSFLTYIREGCPPIFPHITKGDLDEVNSLIEEYGGEEVCRQVDEWGASPLQV